MVVDGVVVVVVVTVVVAILVLVVLVVSVFVVVLVVVGDALPEAQGSGGAHPFSKLLVSVSRPRMLSVVERRGRRVC